MDKRDDHLFRTRAWSVLSITGDLCARYFCELLAGFIRSCTLRITGMVEPRDFLYFGELFSSPGGKFSPRKGQIIPLKTCHPTARFGVTSGDRCIVIDSESLPFKMKFTWLVGAVVDEGQQHFTWARSLPARGTIVFQGESGDCSVFIGFGRARIYPK